MRPWRRSTNFLRSDHRTRWSTMSSAFTLVDAAIACTKGTATSLGFPPFSKQYNLAPFSHRLNRREASIVAATLRESHGEHRKLGDNPAREKGSDFFRLQKASRHLVVFDAD